MMRKDALDKLLAVLDEEYSKQILQLEELAEMVGEINNAKAVKRREQIADFREQLLGNATDDEGDVINQDIAEAIDFLENQSGPDLEDLVEAFKERIEEDLETIKEEYKLLKEVRKNTPVEAFFLAEPDDEDEDEGETDRD